MKKLIQGLIISVLFLFVACEESNDSYELQDFQAISLLGDSLKIPVRSEVQLQRLMDDLEEAKVNFLEDPSEMNYIWYGRRFAYLSDYQTAIQIYTDALENFPYSYKLYRHRGHRYLSIREFDKAIADFEKAYQLMPKDEMEIEPDGIPNSINQPLSNTQFNVLYHYALAHYLKGEFEKAEGIYVELLQNYCDNPDLVVATADWLYMSLRRQEKDTEAAEILSLIIPEMEIIENDSYMKRLMMYKGELEMSELFETDNDDVALNLATQGYGVANWYLYNGDTARAKDILKEVLSGSSWSAFGYIAAEADMSRLEK